MSDHMEQRRRALLVGGTGGIGRAVIEALLAAGFDVTLTYHTNAGRAEALASAHPGRVSAVRLDLGDTDGIGAAVDACLDAAGDWFDAVIIAAGLAGPPQMLARGKAARVAQLAGVNFSGQIVLVQALVQRLLRRAAGRSCSFVAISSVSAVEAQPGMSVYAAAKAGMEHFFKCCAAEYRAWGFRFNIIRSGPVQTDMIDTLPERALDAMRLRLDGAAIPEPEQLCSFVVFAASTDESRGMNGSVMHVDNGYCLSR